MQQKRVLLINEAFYPDESGSSQYLLDLSREFIKSGADVSVLTSSHGYLEQKERFRSRENFEGIKIYRVAPSPIQGKGKLAKILKAAWVNFHFAIKMYLLGSFDVAVVLTSPPLIAFTSCIFLQRTPIVYWVMDVNPDQSVAAGWIKKEGIIHKIFDALHKYVLKKAHLVISLDEYMQKLLLSKGAAIEKLIVRNLWPIIEKNNSEISDTSSSSLNITVMYSGNMGICNPLNSIIDAAKLLKNDSSVKFVISGTGSQEKNLREQVIKSDLHNITFLPYTKRSELGAKLNSADLHIISMADEYCGIIHPSKIYSILATGKPFIFLGPEESFINDKLVKYGVGQRVKGSDAIGLVNAIKREQSLSPDDKSSLFNKRKELAFSFGNASLLCKDILSVSQITH